LKGTGFVKRPMAMDKALLIRRASVLLTRRFPLWQYHDFIGSYLGARHGLNCTLIATDAKGMQRDYGYTAARDPQKLDSINKVGEEAARRTVRRLGQGV